jgi:hypothetical protein
MTWLDSMFMELLYPLDLINLVGLCGSTMDLAVRIDRTSAACLTLSRSSCSTDSMADGY